jgi:hypothetical protein
VKSSTIARPIAAGRVPSLAGFASSRAHPAIEIKRHFCNID